LDWCRSLNVKFKEKVEPTLWRSPTQVW
jgi:hypothetical protein